jgi:hypothetical protein
VSARSRGVFEVELLAVPVWTSYRPLRWTFGLGVEDAPGVQPHQDLGTGSFKVALKSDRVVAGVEDEQRIRPPLGQQAYQVRDLLGGDVVGVFLWAHAPRVDGRHPTVSYESQPHDELVGPAGDDRLPGGVAARVVMVAALRAALRVAPRPRRNVYRVDAGSSTLGREGNTAQQVAQRLLVDRSLAQRRVEAAPPPAVYGSEAKVDGRRHATRTEDRVGQLEEGVCAPAEARMEPLAKGPEPRRGIDPADQHAPSAAPHPRRDLNRTWGCSGDGPRSRGSRSPFR